MNKTLKFIIRGLIFFVIAYGIMFTFLARCKNGFNNHDFPFLQVKRDFISKKIDLPDPRILATGDSRVLAGIIPGEITANPDDAYNLGIPGSSPISVYYALKYYLKKRKAPEYVILSFACFHMEETFDFWTVYVKFNFFNFFDGLEVMKNANRLGDYPFKDFKPKRSMESVAADKMPFEIYKDFILLYLQYPNYYQADLKRHGVFLKHADNVRDYNIVKDNRGYRQYGNNDGINLRDLREEYKGYVTAPLVDFYFNKIFELCREEGITLIYEPMPLNEVKLRNKKRYEAFGQYLQSYQQKYPEFKVNDKVYSFPLTHFGDTSHLNRRGASQLSRNLRQKYGF